MSTQTAPSQDRAADLRPVRVQGYIYGAGEGSGIGRYTHELLRHLAREQGVSVELACPPNYFRRDTHEYGLWPHLSLLAHPSRWRRRVRFLTGQLQSPARLIQHARATAADVIHLSNINHLSFPFWRQLLRGRRPLVAATVHDALRHRGMVWLAYENRQLAGFYRLADALFVHSDDQVRQLVELGVPRERITMVPHGPYDFGQPSGSPAELRRRFDLPADRQVALSFGNIRDDKNIDLLLRALCRSHETVHLHVIGRISHMQRKDEAFYRRLIAELGLERRVTFTNAFVPDEQVADLISACDWVVLPYGSVFTSQSGVLNVALQYRKSVLATATGGLRDVYAEFDVGACVEPDSVDALTAGIETMRQRVAAGATFDFDGCLDRFSWRENARRTVAAYRRLLEERGSAMKAGEA